MPPTSAAATPAADTAIWRHLRALDQYLSRQEARELRHLGITITQYIAMMGLAHSLGQSSAHMARCLGVTPQAASSLLGRLLAQGYVERSPDKHSAAVKVNRLTSQGSQVCDQADDILRSIEDNRSHTLGGAYNELVTLLSKVVHLNIIPGTPDQVAAQEHLQELVRSRLGASVRHLSAAHTDELATAVKSLGLTATQAFVLDAIEPDQPKTTSQIVVDACVPQQSGSTAVNALERLGALDSTPSAHHRGLQLRELTPQGRQLRIGARECNKTLSDDLLRPLATPQAQRLDELIHNALTELA